MRFPPGAFRATACAASLLLSLSATPPGTRGERPQIAGYERFHSRTPALPGGRLLFGELGCGNCHRPQQEFVTALPKSGPVLQGLGGRVSAAWLRAYLSDPQQAKPGATMPHLLAGVSEAERRATVDVLVHFLMDNRDTGLPPLEESKDASLDASSAQRGRDLFHAIGCVACHDPDADETEFFAAAPDAALDEEDEDDEGDGRVTGRRPPRSGRSPSVPWPDLAAKYDQRSLTQFLLHPLLVRPAGRMPDLHLDLQQAADISHYLLGGRRQPDAPFQADPAKVRQGRAVFTGLGCADCHAWSGLPSRRRPQYPTLAALQDDKAGCLSAEPHGTTPYYALSEGQRASLRLALPAPDVTDAAEARLSYTLTVANCYACHQRAEPGEAASRGGLGERRWEYFRTVSAVGEVDLGDEGRIPPALTGAGAKLHTPWLQRTILGHTRLRPHMTARMPGFPARWTDQLAADLTAVDRVLLADVAEPAAATADLVEAGREMLNLGCIQCHPLGEQRLAGVVGVDIQQPAGRLRWSWFHDFLRDPNALKPGTRMPTFFRTGQSTAPDILHGDVEQQIAAMWAYLNADDAPLPDRLQEQRTLDFELRPTERPIVLRTFMKQAGQQAIAVGAPAGLHYAFDAEQCRLAELWKGRFLDAHSTWYDRFTPPAEPLGEHRVSLPDGPAFVRYVNASQAEPLEVRWLGYRLNKEHRPVFLYQAGEVKVSDTLAPAESGLVRLLQFSGDTAGVWIRLAAGNQVRRTSQGVVVDRLTLAIEDEQSRLRRMGGEVRFPLPPPGENSRLKVEYRW